MLLVMRYSGEDLRGVRLIGAAVPEFEGVLDDVTRNARCIAVIYGACRVVCAGAELGGEDCAADREACGWIAERGERFRGEAVLACHLSHHLHQAPGN